MSELTLIKSAKFGDVDADIYARDDEMFMTINQLAACLEYSDKSGIEKIMQRNPYLKDEEFSTTDNLSVLEGRRVVTRKRTVFTEDGIYEVSFLANTPKAQEFRRFIRNLLKSLRRGDLMLTNGTATAAPALTQAQIEKWFAPVLESKLNYQAAWLTAQFDKRIAELTKTINGITTVVPEEYPRPVGYLLKGCPEDMKWKDWVYRLLDCHVVMTGSKHSRRDLLSGLYRYMLKNYTYVADEERKKYRAKHPAHDGKISMIELIADDEKWRDIFSAILIEFVTKKGEGYEIPTRAQVKERESVAPITELQEEIPVQNPVEEKNTEPKLPKWRQRRAKITEYLRPMAESRSDKSKGFCATFRIIYRKMPVDWEAETRNYMRKKGITMRPQRIDMVASSPRLKKIFVETVKLCSN